MNHSEKHIFKIGGKYIQYHPTSDKEYLDAALGAEKTLEQKCVRTEKGIYWKDGLQIQPDISFYSGSAGIAYFYIKLYAVTGDDKYKKIIDEAIDYLLATWQNFEVARMSSPLPEAGNGFYTGLIALTIPMIEAYGLETKAERRCEIKCAVRAITERVLEIAKEEQGHLYWRKNLSMFYDGGVLLQLAQIADFLQDEALLERAVDSVSFLSGLAEQSATGGLIYDGYNGENGYVAPNFEFGSAGAGYVLLRFHELTGKKEFLEKAILCARFLDEISIAQEKGKLIPYRVGENEPAIFYLGACHGPAGTEKFYYKLYQITKNLEYAQELKELFEGLEALGAPGKMSAGLWNCVNYCCGASGHVHTYIGLYLGTGEKRWKKLAQQSADIILGEKEQTENGAVYWKTALDRIAPNVYTIPVGYYDGIAGIAATLLEMYLLEENQFHWSRLVDDPYKEKEEQTNE